MVLYDDDGTLDDDLRVRILKSDLDLFKHKSQLVTGKKYPVMIREMITAFNDGRLRITPTEEQKNQLGELYDVK